MINGTLGTNGLVGLPVSAKWEDRVSDEALNFVQAVQLNFAHGLDTTRSLMPADTPENRMAQLDIFFEALIGVVVKLTATYGSPEEGMEDSVVRILRGKFAYVRERHAEQRKAQIQEKPT